MLQHLRMSLNVVEHLRSQPDKARKESGVNNPSERVAKHVSILRRKRQEIKQDDGTESTTA